MGCAREVTEQDPITSENVGGFKIKTPGYFFHFLQQSMTSLSQFPFTPSFHKTLLSHSEGWADFTSSFLMKIKQPTEVDRESLFKNNK